MSSNKRYPYLGAKLAEERQLREARRQGELQSLSETQIGLGWVLLTIVPDRTLVWGLAWLRFGTVDVRATVRVMRWTPNAIGVQVQVDEDELRCWVWRGAVELLDRREDAWL